MQRVLTIGSIGSGSHVIPCYNQNYVMNECVIMIFAVYILIFQQCGKSFFKNSFLNDFNEWNYINKNRKNPKFFSCHRPFLWPL